MCSALRAWARWRDSILDLVHAAGALEPSGEEAVRPLPRTRKGLQAALNIWPLRPSWRRRTGNQANPIWGCEWYLDSIFQPPSQEWRMKSLPNRCVSFCWGSHWVLYTGSATACRDMYKCYSTPSHLKTINKVWEDQKQEKPSKI